MLVALAAVVMFASSASAQSVVGTWKTISDEDGKAKSHVKIYKAKNGKLYGKIVKLLRDPKAKCTKCDGKRKNKPILGMVILWGLEKDDDEWDDGTILDPKKGKTYDAKIWLDEDNSNRLKVRGYIGPFFRTQTWHRVK
jgi:uncharacterized protein (DUF2147 family)